MKLLSEGVYYYKYGGSDRTKSFFVELNQRLNSSCDIIIDLLESPSISKEFWADMGVFQQKIEAQGNTVVLVVGTIQLEEATDTIPKVPTLQEAKDYIAFERIRRDLGI